MGKAAPPVAAAGALVAVTQVHDFSMTPTSAAIGHGIAAQQAYAGRVAGLPSDIFGSIRQYANHARRLGAAGPAGVAVPGSAGASDGARSASSPGGRPHSSTASSGSRTSHDSARRGGHRTLACHATGGMLPGNYAAIVGFLTAHGYTGLAAAGIAGNIYQESKGNPESVGSGGGGLIGWTPLPAGFVTGNLAADLATQLKAILTYNQQRAQHIPALNSAATAARAADIYMSYFERPGVPAAASREAAAAAVAAACGL